ncbi:MAG: flagellar basal body-associated FliL family protein [Rhodothermales bacterium]
MADPIVPDPAAPPKRRWIPIVAAIVVPAVLGAWVAVSQQASLAAVLGGPAEEVALPVEEEPKAEPTEYGEFLELQGLIVNPAGTEGLRYLMVHVGFESEQAKALEELTMKEIAVRDAVIKILSAKTVPQLSDIGRRDSLKVEIRDTVNGMLREGQIDRLYFTQYVLQ